MKRFYVVCLLLLTLVVACTNDESVDRSDSIVGTYDLLKRATVEYNKGKVVNEVFDTSMKGSLSVKSNGTFSISYIENGKRVDENGSYNLSKSVFSIHLNTEIIDLPYYQNNGYLIITLEDLGDFKIQAYFQKK